MAVTCSVVESYKDYGRCLKIANGAMEILVTIDVGPRIISLCAPGKENMLFNDVEHIRVSKGELFESVFGKGEEYHFYGGHRMWLAPQTMLHTCEPDNAPVEVEQIENGVVLKQKPHILSGMKPQMKITMDPEKALIDIDVTYTNISDTEKSYAAWQITQFAPGGTAIVPVAVRQKPFDRSHRPTMEEMLQPLAPLGQVTSFLGELTEDPRFIMDSQFATLRQDVNNSKPFKIGTPNRIGYGMYVNQGYVATIRADYIEGKCYTDWGCGLETYTDALFLELETLGAFETVKPGESLSHRETIEIQPQKIELPALEDRKAVEAFVAAHLG